MRNDLRPRPARARRTASATEAGLGSPPPPRREVGQTLLEMLVVIGLLALATGVAFPQLQRPYETLAAETARDAVASDLREARATALREGRAVAFGVAADGRSYGWGDRRVQLPAAARLVGTAVVFAPDGGASDGGGSGGGGSGGGGSGGRLAVVERNGRRFGLSVGALSGVVRLEPAS